MTEAKTGMTGDEKAREQIEAVLESIAALDVSSFQHSLPPEHRQVPRTVLLHLELIGTWNSEALLAAPDTENLQRLHAALSEAHQDATSCITGDKHGLNRAAARASQRTAELVMLDALLRSWSEDAVRSLVADAKLAPAQFRALDEKADALIARVQAVVAATEAAAKQAGITRYNKVFAEAEKAHNDTACWWLFASIAIVASLVALTGYSWHTATGGALNIEALAAKVVLVSTLTYALLVSVASYRAHRHNATTNRDRRHALTTFEVFTKSASSDDATKNAVLLAAMGAIFNPRPTGYLGKHQEVVTPVTALVDAAGKGK